MRNKGLAQSYNTVNFGEEVSGANKRMKSAVRPKMRNNNFAANASGGFTGVIGVQRGLQADKSQDRLDQIGGGNSNP